MDLKNSTILHLAPSFFPHLGGVETHVWEVATTHSKQGAQVSILTVQSSKKDPLDEVLEQLHIVRMPLECKNDKWKTWSWIWRHKNYFNVDIVHVHDVSWWLAPLLPQMIKFFFITFHGWEGIYPVPFSNKLQRFFFALCANKTIHVGEYIQKFYWDMPTAVTYGGVAKFTGVKNEKNLLPILPKTRFIFVGRLEPENDLEKYFSLLDLYKQNKTPFSVLWIGDGTLRNKAAQYGKVVGMVADVPEYIQNADIVFASSYLSILQAQVQGKIVASFYSQPLKEAYLQLFSGTAAMIISAQPDEILGELEKISQDRAWRRKLQLSAQNFALQQTWQKVADLYQELWSSL